MNEYYIRVHYYEHADMDDDFVLFVVPKTVSHEQLLNTIIEVKSNYTEEEYGDTLEMTDDIMESVADRLKGLWKYVPSCATVQIGYDE